MVVLPNRKVITLNRPFLLSILIFLVSCSRQEPVQEQVIVPLAETTGPVLHPSIQTINKNNVDSVLLAYGRENPETKVRMETSMGTVTIRLYKETPLHRANFLRLVKTGFYDSTLFYRVVNGFVAQGGDNDDPVHQQLKVLYGWYSIPPEFNQRYFHKRGALAMARDYDNNPGKRSEPFDFYFVHGRTFSKWDLDDIEKQGHVKFSPSRRQYYETTGGAAHLDFEHTVFGEIISGFEVIDKITQVPVDHMEWPEKDILILSTEALPD